MFSSVSNTSAQHLIRQLAANDPPDYVQQVGDDLLHVPPELFDHAESIRKSGIYEANSQLLSECLPNIPEKWDRFVSGADSLKMRQLASGAVEEFFVSLFQQISRDSPVGVTLCAWDLFHGHLFVTTDGDLGLLFHAKEFPREFTFSRQNIYPIGHEKAGGELDPRIGTRDSILNMDYSLRNYIWTLRGRAIWLVKPLHAKFPQELLQIGGERFFTIDERCFGEDLGAVNFFSGQICTVPKRTPPESKLLVGEKELLSSLDVDELEDLSRVLSNPATFKARLAKLPQSLCTGDITLRIIQVKEEFEIDIENKVENMKKRNFEEAHSKEALKLCGGNLHRAERLLAVAFSRYRCEDEAQSSQSSWPLDTAHRVLYAIDPTGCDVILALQTLERATGSEATLHPKTDHPQLLSDAIEAACRQRRAEFSQECSARLDRLMDKFAPSHDALKPSSDLARSNTTTPLVEPFAESTQLAGPSALPTPATPCPPREQNAAEAAPPGPAPPRCCTVHSLLHRHAMQQPLLPGEQAVVRRLQQEGEGDAWVVLVGGEAASVMHRDRAGTRAGAYLGGHSSLQQIGRAYAALVPWVGRERIIVMVQLQETLDWLRAATASEAACEAMAGRISLLPALQHRLRATEEDCTQLIADGGADYDGSQVNPAQLLRVLLGEARHTGEKAVPQEGVGALTLIISSHGNAHEAHPASTREDGTLVPARHDEWYCHFPHPSPLEDDHLYNVVSYHGSPAPAPESVQWNQPRHRYRLYSTMLFQAYHRMLARSPARRLVLLYQFCLSGGAAKFMNLPSYRNFFSTQTWPMYVMVTSGDYEPALGAFLSLWLGQLTAALVSGRRLTLQELFTAVEKQYWEEEYPEVASSNRCNPWDDAMTDPKNPRTMGTIARFSGVDVRLQMSMDDVEISELINAKAAHAQARQLSCNAVAPQEKEPCSLPKVH
ncbi:hypothetical protein CYMTET_55762 [Cymbomonas tetramitiformis]|uniref:Uncharacterized protein n=1 Tax=Cymbomonas tetramitiformis TaxID=36881 RepID=A0AAE0BDQ8_9CHLO|nr:hypothetical protein CYMTET_55762 [Cymbomonas tetramitiformis]